MADEAQPVTTPSNSEVEDDSDLRDETTPQMISYLKSTFDAEFARMGSQLVSRENLLRRELEMQTNKNKRLIEVEAMLLIREERLKREIESQRYEIESIKQEHERETSEKAAELEKSRNEMFELRQKNLQLERENAACKSQVDSLTKGVWGIEKGISKMVMGLNEAKEEIFLINGDEGGIKSLADNIATAEEVLMFSSNDNRKRVSKTSPKSAGLANPSTKADLEENKQRENGDPTGKSYTKKITASEPSKTGNESDHLKESSKKKIEVPGEKSTTANKSSSEEKTRTIVAKGKEKAEIHHLRSDKDLKDAVRNTLKLVDFNTTMFTDVLEQLALKLKIDITEKNWLIKHILPIRKELEKLAEGGDADNAAVMYNNANAEVLMCSSKGKRKRVSEASPNSGNASSKGMGKSSPAIAWDNLLSDEDLKDANC